MILNKVGRNPPALTIWISQGKNSKTPTVSAQQIEQQVEGATQSIIYQLVDHVNQQLHCLEAIVSKSTNLNDDGQDENRHDRYHPIDNIQDVSGFLNKQMGIHSKPPKLSLF